MHCLTEQLSQSEVYKLLIGTVQPRPIAWVGTTNQQGINNLAPFSFFNVFSVKPSIVGFSPINKPDGSKKDTLTNIMEMKCFTLNIVSESLGQQMSQTAAELPQSVDEFEYAQLTAASSKWIKAPCVAESLVVFECELNQIIHFGNHAGAGNLILGEVKGLFIDDSIYQGSRVDFKKLNPIGRLAGDYYSTIKDLFTMERG